MVEKATPGFAAGAAGALAGVSGQIAGVRQQAQSGSIKLTEDAAKKLLAAFDSVHLTLHSLVNETSEIGNPLKLGDNFVGRAMSDRLQAVASGDTTSALPVLRDFGAVLTDLDLSVRAAAGMYVAEDEHAESRLKQATGRIDQIAGNQNGAH
jgi:hypothetical protein